MPDYFGLCEVCEKPVTSATSSPAFEVRGFEVLRRDGGANQIRNRERIPGRVWHEVCLPSPKIHAGQETLGV